MKKIFFIGLIISSMLISKTMASGPPTTTWDGTAWNNGVPDATFNVIIAGDYNVKSLGTIKSNDFTVNTGSTVTLQYASDTVLVSGNLVANGLFNMTCISILTVAGTQSGNINVQQPTITPTSLSDGQVGSPYNATLSTDIVLANPIWQLVSGSLPSSVTFNGGILSGTPSSASGIYSITISVTDGAACNTSTSYDWQIDPSSVPTTWNGTAWDNGSPSYSNDAVIASGNFTGTIVVNNLTINAGASVTLLQQTDHIDANGVITNNGTLYVGCLSVPPKTMIGTGTVLPKAPAISPSSGALPNGTYGSSYSYQLSLDQDPEPTWSIIGTAPFNIDGSGRLNGNPTGAGDFTFSVGATSAGPPFGCGDTVTYTLHIDGPTTWNGTAWSNGTPNSTTDAIIDGIYSTKTNGNLTCNNLTITANGTINLTTNTSVMVSANLDNSNGGTINKDCANATLSYASGVPNANYINPVITTSSLPNGYLGLPYTASLSVTESTGNNPFWTIGGSLPPGISYSGNILSGTPTSIGTYNVSVQANIVGCTSNVAPFIIVIASLPDPNLTLSSVSKTFGDPAFKVHPISASNGAITYRVSPANGCATIDSVSGLVTVNCAGPVSQITIQAIQQATTYYSTDTATATLFLFKAVPTIAIDNIGVLLGDTSAAISYTSNSDGTASYLQVNHDTSVARVSAAGKVTSFQEGTFTATLTLSETNKYLSISEEVSLQVFKSLQAPVANPDTISILVGQTVTFNILANDIGYTGKILPELTDIDLDNVGIQNKYYEPSSGTFLIDTKGNLTFQPFSAAIGDVKLYYTVTDSKGKVSQPGLITITIKQPGGVPALKATQLFTPNGDGLNDEFVIGYIDKNKKNYFKLYDRSGYEVYSEDNYKNNWGGTLASGKSIEDGIYYFIFSENDGEREAKGILQIKR